MWLNVIEATAETATAAKVTAEKASTTLHHAKDDGLYGKLKLRKIAYAINVHAYS